MKKKVIISMVLVVALFLCSINMCCYAVTPPKLAITSISYSVHDKMADTDVHDVEEGKTIQLYAIIKHGNDLADPRYPDGGLGSFVDEVNLAGVTWTSSDEKVATVDSTGKVKGVSSGSTTITAKYNEEECNYDINVKQSVFQGIGFERTIGPNASTIRLGENKKFYLSMYNITDAEKENLTVVIEDESIAELDDIDFSYWDENRVSFDVKSVSSVKTEMIATLLCNGKEYSSTIPIIVQESFNELKLSSKDSTDLPQTLNKGDSLQLIAILSNMEGSVGPRELDSESITWTSSNEKVVKVDNKGVVTAIGDGTATISGTYKVENETIVATYDVKVIDTTKPKNDSEKDNSGDANNSEESDADANKNTENPAKSNNDNEIKDSVTNKNESTVSKKILPQTGKNTTIIIITTVAMALLAIIIRKKYRKL